MVGNSKRGFTDHNSSRRSLILQSVVTIPDDMQDQHCSCITGYSYINTFNQFNMEKALKCRPALFVFDLLATTREQSSI